MRGAIVGMLVLAGLEALVSTADAANRAGGLLAGIGGFVDRFLDPTVAAIPDRRNGAGVTVAAPASPSSSTGPAGPPRHAPVTSWAPGGQRRQETVS